MFGIEGGRLLLAPLEQVLHLPPVLELPDVLFLVQEDALDKILRLSHVGLAQCPLVPLPLRHLGFKDLDIWGVGEDDGLAVVPLVEAQFPEALRLRCHHLWIFPGFGRGIRSLGGTLGVGCMIMLLSSFPQPFANLELPTSKLE